MKRAKAALALLLALVMTISFAACGGDANTPADSRTDGDTTGAAAQSGEALSLPLYNRLYMFRDIAVLVKDDGSALVDLGEDYEEESENIMKQAATLDKKWAGIIKASSIDRCVWLVSTDRELYEITEEKTTLLKENVVSFSRDYSYNILVYGDGTVELVGDRSEKLPDLSGMEAWTDIVQVAHGDTVALGLKKDGTVVAVGSNSMGQMNVSDWTDIVQLEVFDTSAETEGFSLGLKKDGTLVATGQYFYGCDISQLLAITDVKQIAHAWHTVVLLKNDGTVVCDPSSDFLSGVSDIAAIDFDGHNRLNYIYVQEDGTVVFDPEVATDSRTGLSMKR